MADLVRSPGLLGKLDNLFDEQGTSHLRNVTKDLHSSAYPEPPKDGVVHGKGEARLLLAIFCSPVGFALFVATTKYPIKSLVKSRRDFSFFQTSVILFSD